MMEKLLTNERVIAESETVNAYNYVKLLKFIAIGVLNTAIAFFLFAAFLYLELHYSLAVLFTYILVVLINFKMYGRLVFNSRDNKLIFRFVCVYVFMYLLNIVCLKVFGFFSINLYVGGLFLIVPFAIISFILNNCYVFRSNVNNSTYIVSKML